MPPTPSLCHTIDGKSGPEVSMLDFVMSWGGGSELFWVCVWGSAFGGCSEQGKLSGEQRSWPSDILPPPNLMAKEPEIRCALSPDFQHLGSFLEPPAPLKCRCPVILPGSRVIGALRGSPSCLTLCQGLPVFGSDSLPL